MSVIIENAIEKLRSTAIKANKLSDDFVFGMVCYKYFYNDGYFTNSDFENSFVDGRNDGGVDLIGVNETDLSKNLVLVQSKNVKDVHSKDDIKDIFLKMAQTVQDFRVEKVGAYSARLRRIYREKFDDAHDDMNFNIELVVFLGFDKSDRFKTIVDNHLLKVKELEDYEISIFYKNEIEQQIESYDDAKRFVSNGEIYIFHKDGIIYNGDNGILVNISAIGLRKLYDLYKDDGLFEQNFRYFIRNKKIDAQIHESLKSKRDLFWFLNNGIIIGCKEFRVDGTNVKLTDFSIVNGCQTTTILGKYSGPNEDLDFPIPCKIVKPDKLGDEYFNEFIARIAEASNSQKPISDRDLKSNLSEQRELQRNLKRHNPKIYLEIKRGEGILKTRKVESWQKIKNDGLGQLILSVFLQQPGTARSSKRKIFADNSTYNRIFRRNHDLVTIVDLLKLSDLYDQFINQADDFNEIASNVAKNGKYSILAIIGFLIKYRRKLIDLSIDTNLSEWASEVTLDNLNGELFDPNRPDDFDKALNSLFRQIIQTLSTLYSSRIDSETSVTNFFKTDKKYHSIILERIKSEYLLDEYEFTKIQEKMDRVFK